MDKSRIAGKVVRALDLREPETFDCGIENVACLDGIQQGLAGLVGRRKAPRDCLIASCNRLVTGNVQRFFWRVVEEGC